MASSPASSFEAQTSHFGQNDDISSTDEPTEHFGKLIQTFLATRDVTPHRYADIVFDRLSVEGNGKGVQAAPTIRTASKYFLGLLNPLTWRQKPHSTRPILRNFSGTIGAGEMLLVIGKPGSGCTTFLKTLANMREEYKDTTGQITYGGRSAKEMAESYPAEITFCAEDDDHFPTLTVAETLRFAVEACWGTKASSARIEDAVSLLARLVGLNGVMETRVGNEYIRGISGGERRRVSLAESLATCSSLICLDNPTSGLDSSTALEFIQMMRAFANQIGCVSAMSIYQGSDAIAPMFDKVIVINSGREIFYGKVTEAKAYFEDLGFECSPRTTITDFLNSMSAGPEVRRVREERQGQVPVTAEDFERAFQAHQSYQSVLSKVRTANSKQTDVPTKRSRYALPLIQQILICAFRQFRILITDYNTWAIEALCIIIQSLVLGTLFRNQKHETQSFFIFAAALFYSVLVPALQSMSEFGNTFAQRPLILKHKRYQFYRPLAYAFGLVVTDMAWKVVAITYNIPLYFLTNFQRTPGHFLTWFFTVYIEHLALSMFFRAIAIFSPNMNRAVLPVGIMFNLLVLYTGLYVPAPQMQVWLGWLRYCNPLYYAFESVMVNEFSSSDYACSTEDFAPAGLGYNSIANQVCAVQGSNPGQALVSGISYLQAQYGFQGSHLWRNIGINASLFFAFAICTGIGMEYLKLPAGRLATVFYKAEPEVFAHQITETVTFDQEKGDIDEDTPPLTTESRRSTKSPKDLLGSNSSVFAWQNVSLHIKTANGEKELLHDLNGSVESGQLTALMGVSGAGKTTLLNTLAGRSSQGTFSGNLFLNGKPLSNSFSRLMGYVQQQDIHLPTQTIREALQMTARLRRPPDIPNEEKDAYVEAVIKMLEMEDFADALIGVPGAGLNLEQRKRVTIGVELAAKPKILCLDEPSSGLDGQSAVSIIRLLRKLADAGQAILCTIHQPAAELIETFDHLYLLVRGGKKAYDGPLGSRCSVAIDYFGQHARRCGESENPAEYFLEVVGAGSRSIATKDWSQIWSQSRERRARDSNLESSILNTSQDKAVDRSDDDRTYNTSFFTQLDLILRRTWLFYWREPDYGVSKLMMNVGNSLLNSLTYLQSAPDQRGAYNRVFSAFMALIVGPPLGLQVEPRFTALRDIFIHREKASSAYHWTVFVVAAILVELPYAVITSLVYWLLWYFPVGYFYSSSRAGYSFLMYELFAVFATSLAQLCAATMPNLNSTFMANGFFFMFCNTFAGTLSPKPVTPSGWKWYYNVSPLFYFGEGMTTDVLQGLLLSCGEDETYDFSPPANMSCGRYTEQFLSTATGYLLDASSNTNCQYCRYKNGDSYYLQYGYDFANRYRNLGIFIAFIAFNFTFVFVVTYLTKVRRWKRA